MGWFVVALPGAGAAEGAAVANYFALEVDAFAASGADYAGAFEAGQVLGLHFHLDPFFVEEDFIGEVRVGFLLAGFFL